MIRLSAAVLLVFNNIFTYYHSILLKVNVKRREYLLTNNKIQFLLRHLFQLIVRMCCECCKLHDIEPNRIDFWICQNKLLEYTWKIIVQYVNKIIYNVNDLFNQIPPSYLLNLKLIGKKCWLLSHCCNHIIIKLNKIILMHSILQY